jgi:hypothetical protein
MNRGYTGQEGGSPNVQNPLALRKQHSIHHDGETTLAYVHATPAQVAVFELTPPHPPRVETAEYKAAHHRLTVERDLPCTVCGVRRSTLGDPIQNKFNATVMETHHWPVERSLADACDPGKVGVHYPEVTDHDSLMAFVDSERNLMVLCDIHHRSLEQGIHHLLCQDFAVLPFLYDGYQIVASAKDRDQALKCDDGVEKKNGME